MFFHSDIYQKTIDGLMGKSSDITKRTVQCHNETVTILFVKQLTDRQMLSDFVIRPIVEHCAAAKKALRAEEALETVIYLDDCHVEQDESLIESSILGGMTVLLFSTDKVYLVANLKKVEHRAIKEPELNYNERAPRDSFVENLDANLSLMRYRMKDRNLRVDYVDVGERTSTRIAMLYIQDIANEACIQEIRKRVYSIHVDVIVDSGDVQTYLLNKKQSVFPQVMVIERSDMAAENLLEGKVLLIVDGSPLALSAPVAFAEFMYACDDRYENKLFGMFMRLLRYAAFFVSFSASSYWIAIVSFHSDTLPAGFIIALAQARSRVPFNAVLAVLVLEFIMELIREALLRVPTKIGSAIAIVGALIIGQAAITAGVFSPLLLILISVEFLASFGSPIRRPPTRSGGSRSRCCLRRVCSGSMGTSWA